MRNEWLEINFRCRKRQFESNYNMESMFINGQSTQDRNKLYDKLYNLFNLSAKKKHTKYKWQIGLSSWTSSRCFIVIPIWRWCKSSSCWGRMLFLATVISFNIVQLKTSTSRSCLWEQFIFHQIVTTVVPASDSVETSTTMWRRRVAGNWTTAMCPLQWAARIGRWCS